MRPFAAKSRRVVRGCYDYKALSVMATAFLAPPMKCVNGILRQNSQSNDMTKHSMYDMLKRRNADISVNVPSIKGKTEKAQEEKGKVTVLKKADIDSPALKLPVAEEIPSLRESRKRRSPWVDSDENWEILKEGWTSAMNNIFHYLPPRHW